MSTGDSANGAGDPAPRPEDVKPDTQQHNDERQKFAFAYAMFDAVSRKWCPDNRWNALFQCHDKTPLFPATKQPQNAKIIVKW